MATCPSPLHDGTGVRMKTAGLLWQMHGGKGTPTMPVARTGMAVLTRTARLRWGAALHQPV